MNKKLTLLSAAITTALAAPAFADINDIFISEYVEGSSNNKAIEITNKGSDDFTFDDSIGLYYDGGKYINMIKAANGSSVLKDLTVPANQSVVIVGGESSKALLDAVKASGATSVTAGTYDQVKYSAMSFNGDDSVLLAGTTEPKSNVHDIIGVAGSKWGENLTFRRLKTATTPQNSFSVKDWLTESEDTFAGLGDPELAEKSDDPTPCTEADGNIDPKLIAEVQGSGFRSPLIEDGKFISDNEYLVTGIVSGVATNLVKGFYLYDSDGDETTSDGVFVSTSTPIDSSMIGQKVCVKGVIEESYGQTQILPTDGKWEVMEEDAGAPTAVTMTRIPADGDDFRKTLERHEGMLVRLPEDMDPSTPNVKEDMRVSRTFSTDFDSNNYRSNMVLSYKRPNMQPNQEHIAGSAESLAKAAENRNYRVYLESDKKAPSGDIPYYPGFKSNPAENYVRINDSVIGLEGLVAYSYGEFRIIPTNEVDGTNFKFEHNTDRESSPTLDDTTTYDKFAVRIATQNVLNFFNSPYGGAENTHGDNRGAESAFEFERQKTKIVEAIYGLNADIVGLMEIENNGFGDFSAITELVNAVNEKYYEDKYSKKHYKTSVQNKYVFVGFDSDGNTVLDEFDSVGSDAITSGLLYRPSKVTLEFSKVIPMPSQKAPMITDENGAAIINGKGEVRESGKNYQRNTVAATFLIHNTGKKLTLSVNHLKSKGSTCWEDWQGWQNWDKFDPSEDDVKNDDYQGNCENFRVAAAAHLGEQMQKMGGDQVILGDMNSYAMEDPMLVLTSNPTGKTLKAARDTFIGYKPQFGENGAIITKTYGYLNAVSIKDAEKNKPSWSYSYNDEIGSLDHVLITPSLQSKLLDATDWHINAAESPLYDYSSKYKPSNHPFYDDTAYRSSDHDSALIALGYGYGETDGERVLLASKSGRMEVAYPIPSAVKVEAGQIATISFSPTPKEMDKVALPNITLTEDGEQTVFFDVNGIEPGQYTMTMELIDASTKAAIGGSRVQMEVEVAKRDSLTPKVTVEPYDGSGGGSFGIFGLLSMLGLGFLRRTKK